MQQNHQELRAPYILVSVPNSQVVSSVTLTMSKQPNEKQIAAIRTSLEKIPAVTQVLITGSSIVINKSAATSWEILRINVIFILETILFEGEDVNHYSSQLPLPDTTHLYTKNMTIA